MVQITENTIEIFAIVCTPVDAHVARLSTCLVHQQRLGARVSMSISYVYRHLVFGSFPRNKIFAICQICRHFLVLRALALCVLLIQIKAIFIINNPFLVFIFFPSLFFMTDFNYAVSSSIFESFSYIF